MNKVTSIGDRQSAADRTWLLATIAAALLGIVLRIQGIFSDFWLDEIYSYMSVRGLQSPAGVFTGFLNDNNHYLNSLLMYWIGDTPDWPLYRIPSMIAGILTIPLVWLSARKAGIVEAAIAAILISTSYLLINFSSEARGYGLVIFFAAATWYCLQRCASKKSLRWRVLLWVAIVLGLLSHLTFLFVFVAAMAWFPYDRMVQRERWSSVAVQWLLCFTVPLAFAAGLYLLVIRHSEGGYGPGYRMVDVLAETLSYFGGEGQIVTPATVIWGGIFAGMVPIALYLLWKRGRSEWLFFLVAALIAPVLALLVHRPATLFVRYFLLCIFFGYLALSPLLTELLRRGKPARIAAVVFLALFIAGNGFQVARFIEHGRGDYPGALRYIEENSPEKTIGVASDFVFRNEVLVEYYKRFLNSGKELLYVESYPGDFPPGWFIVHAIGKPPLFRERITDPYGNAFFLREVFPCAGPSGFTWAVYRVSNETF